MTGIVVGLSLVLAASLGVNGVLWWYSRHCVRKIIFFHEEVESLQQDLQGYSKHCYDLSRSEAYF